MRQLILKENQPFIETLEQAELIIRRAGIVLDELVEGKQLLEVCGFDTSSSNQATVFKRQIEKHALREGQDFTASMQQSTGGRPKNVYHFSINAANHILLAAMTPEGKQARQEAIDLKTDQDRVANLVNNGIAFVSQDMKSLAEVFGLKGNQALLAASRATQKLTGHNPIALLGVELQAERKEKTFTVTELGKACLDGLSGRKVNTLLCEAGLQVRIDKQWELTEAGKTYAELLDTGKSHSNGTPVKQIKWFRSVVDCVREYCL